MYCVATFDTTHMALRFEKICRNAGYCVRIIPVPRELSSSCGFACRFPCDKREELNALAHEARVEIASLHSLPSEGGQIGHEPNC